MLAEWRTTTTVFCKPSEEEFVKTAGILIGNWPRNMDRRYDAPGASPGKCRNGKRAGLYARVSTRNGH
jgi:hypothetical protein